MYSKTDSSLNIVDSIVTQKQYYDTRYLPEQNRKEVNSYHNDDNYSPGKNEKGPEPLSTRNAVKLLLEDRLKSEVCRYCLKCTPSLSELDKIMEVASNGSLYKITIKDMIAAFHPFKMDDDHHFPNKICELCLDRTIAGYLFAQQCDRAERALRNCFQDIYDKLDKLDPLERPKKRGRHKRHPNHNIIHVQHEHVADYAEPAFHLVNTCEAPATDAPVGDLECLKCYQLLPNLEALLNHSKSHPKSMWYHCRLCGRSFARLLHLKKHFRLDHGSPERAHTEASAFVCATCGVTCEDHHQYLQHLERHKFKKLLTHVMQNRMQRYCSLCVREAGALTPLRAPLQLHAAAAPLAGHTTLATLLAHTLPQNKSKYRELAVRRRAPRLALLARGPPSNDRYKFAQPLVLHKDYIGSSDVYSFFFSDPETLNVNKIIPVINNDHGITELGSDRAKLELIVPSDGEKVTTDDGQTIDKTTTIVQTAEDQALSETTTFMISNVNCVTVDKTVWEYQPTTIDHQLAIIEHQPTTIEHKPIIIEHQLTTIEHKQTTIEHRPTTIECKIKNTADNNWIFKNTDEYNHEGYVRSSKDCSFCWVFKRLNKCDVCNKLNIQDDTNDKSQNTVKLNSLVSDSGKEEYRGTADDGGTFNETDWKCSICLTDNKRHSRTCYCCESDSTTHVQKFHFKRIFENVSAFKECEQQKVGDVMCERSAWEKQRHPKYIEAGTQCTPDSSRPDNSSTISVTCNSAEPQLIISSMDTDSIVEEKPSMGSIDGSECEAMDTDDTELGPSRISLGFPLIFSESAPVCLEPAPITMDLAPVSLETSVISFGPATGCLGPESASLGLVRAASGPWAAPRSLQFSIGSGDRGPKTYRRPPRKMTRASHK